MIYKIEVTTKIGCKNNCNYCPQDKLINNYPGNDVKELSIDNFRRCLKNLIYPTRIHFSGMCEPFLNENCSKLIELSYRYSFMVGVYSTLIGAKIDDLDIFRDRLVSPFMIHIPNFCYMNFKESEVDNWCLLFEKLITVNNTFNLISLQKDGISDKILNIVNKHDKEITIPEISSRAGNLKDKTQKTGQMKCKSNRLFQNVLLPNGNVVLCCNDFSQQHILGNLFTQTTKDIIDGIEFKKICDSFEQETSDSLCRKCDEFISFKYV